MKSLSRGLKDTLTPPSTRNEAAPCVEQEQRAFNLEGITTLTPSNIHDMCAKNVESGLVVPAALAPSWMTKSSGYSHEAYSQLVKQTIDQINALSTLKGGEYAGDVDRLANFRRNAANLGIMPETVWAVYAGKHWDAIQQYVNDLQHGKSRPRMESLAGRADDLIVYCILFKALLEDRDAVH